jgi:hypothetical protein
VPPRRAPESSPDEKTASPSAADSLTDSSAASTDGHGFIADPGPAHDGEHAPPPPEGEPAAELLDGLAWDSEVVRGLLTAQGQALHTFAGKGEDDWIYTRDELRAIAPPLTRILNRYDATRAAAGTGDELALLIGLTGYVGRSISVRRDVLRAQRADEPDDDEVLGAPMFGAEVDLDDELPETPPTPRRR